MLWRSSVPARRPPGFIEPCLPTLVDTAPSGSQWVFEINHDGFRFTCRRDRYHLRVFSRRGHDWTDKVPAISRALAMAARSVTIDCEGVACGPDGVSDFGADAFSGRPQGLAHIDSADGNAVFRHACVMGLEGIVRKAPGQALSVGPVAGLDQGSRTRTHRLRRGSSSRANVLA